MYGKTEGTGCLMTVCKERVERSFSRAASTYEEFTFFQKQCADDVAALLRSSAVPEPARILEAGCGTGLLTHRLRTLYPSALIVSTDLSAGMITFCRSRFAKDEAICFARHDFDRPYEESGFDLAVSSLSLQWSSNLRGAFANFAEALKQNGELLVSIPLSSSLPQMREAFQTRGMEYHGLELPGKEAVEKALLPEFNLVESEVRTYCESYPSFHALLKAMRLNGTSGGNSGTPPSVLKTLFRECGTTPFHVTYDVGMFRGVKHS